MIQPDKNNMLNRLKNWREKIFKKKYATGFLPPQYKNIETGNLLFGHSRGSYLVERDDRQEIFWKFLEKNGFDSYGYYTKDPSIINDSKDNVSFKNDVFCIRPYYWGDDESIYSLPNFEYYPSNLTISWYKYPFRDSYSNRTFSYVEFFDILKHCSENMKK